MALIVVALQALACIGLGLIGLRLLRINDSLGAGERPVFAFALGFGVLGWLLFFPGIAGWLTPGVLLLVLALGASGVALLRRKDLPRPDVPFDTPSLLLLALLAGVLALDLLGALAPPADADSLAYHFASPRLFLAEGRVLFIPRVADGAVPYLIQMTYLPVMGLGGEKALTLWTVTCGWAAAATMYVLARRHLTRALSLALALLLVTTPAFVYGVGSGQVEVKIIPFVLLSAWAAAESLRSGRSALVALAGIGAGFYIGAKYLGLLYAAALGLCVMIHGQWFRRALIFGLAALMAGFQWYAWNAGHTGDPAFPMAFQWLGWQDLSFWTREQDLAFKELFFDAERAVPRSPLWLALYPFKATVDPLPVFESDRIGFGPYGLLILPFALLGAWRFRDRLRASPLTLYAAVALIFYVLWFLTGSSQRIRHLLPVLPLFLLCATVAAARYVEAARLSAPFAAAVILTVLLQLAGHGVFSLKYIRYMLGGFDREAFLLNNVSFYAPVPWINQNLRPDDRVLIQERQLLYHMVVPYFFAAPMRQFQIDLRPEHIDLQRLRDQLRAQGITHLLIARIGTRYEDPYQTLQRRGCLELVRRFDTQRLVSRTLPAISEISLGADLVRFLPERCVPG